MNPYFDVAMEGKGLDKWILEPTRSLWLDMLADSHSDNISANWNLQEKDLVKIYSSLGGRLFFFGGGELLESWKWVTY